MAFVTKTWKDRLVEYAGRRKIKNVATGEETLVDVSRSEGTVSQAGDAFSAANMNNLEQRIKNEFDTVNSSLRPHIRLNLPSVSADAASVGDYVNKNYLHTYTSVTFDIVAGNTDFFSGTLSTDSLADAAGRTVWGFIQQRSNSVNNSKLYKYFAVGIGGAGSVSPFSKQPTKLGTGYNSEDTVTIDCTSLENYKQLTSDNFYIVITSAMLTMCESSHTTNRVKAVSKTYNASTGKLTINQCMPEKGDMWVAVFYYEVYCL